MIAYLACSLSKRGVRIMSPSILFIVGPTSLDFFWPLQRHILAHAHGMLRCGAQALVSLNACFLTGSFDQRPRSPHFRAPSTLCLSHQKPLINLTFQTSKLLP
ncbi:hypothetical protein QBC32DRAFT_133760 [Pseudoneurospora amorphoporcata]|uniref:Uncharacterized protein n=1 Tax=Pseudoneurospora amorphoporcata TaxID=241081 RepID=A0AAN6NVR7_9PEZI|nr:hypothetical protein QBC32DRAFT_133760 [Pseudoneurospora amorphoporcata]